MDITHISDSPNSSISHVRRFLAKPPKGAARLVLQVAVEGASPLTLQQWEVADVRPALASEILDALDGHAAETEQHVTGMLLYRDAEGKKVAGKVVRRRYQPELLEDEPGTLEALDGSPRALLMQQQRHFEIMTRIYSQAQGGVLQQMLRMNEHLMSLLDQLTTRVSQTDAQLERARAELAALKEAFAEGTGGGEQPSPTEERVLKLAEQLAPVVVAKLGA